MESTTVPGPETENDLALDFLPLQTTIPIGMHDRTIEAKIVQDLDALADVLMPRDQREKATTRLISRRATRDVMPLQSPTNSFSFVI